MKRIYVVLGSIQLFVAIGAIPAGIGYLTDISGTRMGTSTDLLVNSPLNTFLIPALFLLIVNGLGNLFGAYLSLRRNKTAGIFGLGLGIILTIWIIIQVYWIGLLSFMQPLFFVIGLLQTILSIIIIKKSHK